MIYCLYLNDLVCCYFTEKEYVEVENLYMHDLTSVIA